MTASWRLSATTAILLALAIGTAEAKTVRIYLGSAPQAIDFDEVKIVSVDNASRRYSPASLTGGVLQSAAVLVGADYIFSLDLPPGAYTVSVEGWQSKTFFVRYDGERADIFLGHWRQDGRGGSSFPGSINHTGFGGGDGDDGGGGDDD